MTESPTPVRNLQPYSLLLSLFGDAEMVRIFAEAETVNGWLLAEAALARAQRDCGVIDEGAAEAIVAAATLENIDMAALQAEARNVGYPILPLVRQIDAAADARGKGQVHLGATTQDIMDTGLALQLRAGVQRLDELLEAVGDELAARVVEERETLIAARTHGQQAVPTTFGAKLAVYLSEFDRHRSRLAQVHDRVAVVSLFGAGGTSAALGPKARALRDVMARHLGLTAVEVPWHVARDGIAEFLGVCAMLAASCSRFAREVIDLSRTEIGEVAEVGGHHRGASSTMPQKVNPISSEAVVGMAAAASALASAATRAMEAGHERAAGEWQVEWHVVPQLAVLAASALRTTGHIVDGLRVDREAMRRNVVDGVGLLMAEAYMMRVAELLGRERAHDLVYEAAREARTTRIDLEEALRQVGARHGEPVLLRLQPIAPEEYLGEAQRICDVALRDWRRDAPPSEPEAVPDGRHATVPAVAALPEEER